MHKDPCCSRYDYFVIDGERCNIDCLVLFSNYKKLLKDYRLKNNTDLLEEMSKKEDPSYLLFKEELNNCFDRCSCKEKLLWKKHFIDDRKTHSGRTDT